MKKGHFLNFLLPFTKMDGSAVSADLQARCILQKTQQLLKESSIGVMITYSANYDQTCNIYQTYEHGNWKTGTNGANQAAVMYAMEGLLENEFSDLRYQMRIAPITTMAGGNSIAQWNDGFHMKTVEKDLKQIELYLDQGWTVLGWQNQKTVHNQDAPYAIGGGIATLPQKVSKKIQHTLKTFSIKFN